MQSNLTNFDQDHDLSTESNQPTETLFSGEINANHLETITRSLMGRINDMLLTINSSEIVFKTPEIEKQRFLQRGSISESEWEEYSYHGDQEHTIDIELYRDIYRRFAAGEFDDTIPITLRQHNNPTEKQVNKLHDRGVYDPYAPENEDTTPKVGELEIDGKSHYVVIDPSAEVAEASVHNTGRVTINAVHKLKEWLSTTDFNRDALVLVCLTESEYGGPHHPISQDESCVLTFSIFNRITLEEIDTFVLKGDKNKKMLTRVETDIEKATTLKKRPPSHIGVNIPIDGAHSEEYRTGNLWGIYKLNLLRDMLNDELKDTLNASSIRLTFEPRWPMKTIHTYKATEDNNLETDVTTEKIFVPYKLKDDVKEKMRTEPGIQGL